MCLVFNFMPDWLIEMMASAIHMFSYSLRYTYTRPIWYTTLFFQSAKVNFRIASEDFIVCNYIPSKLSFHRDICPPKHQKSVPLHWERSKLWSNEQDKGWPKKPNTLMVVFALQWIVPITIMFTWMQNCFRKGRETCTKALFYNSNVAFQVAFHMYSWM